MMLLRFLLPGLLAISPLALQAQTPASSHSSETTFRDNAHALVGRAPGFYRYAAAGVGLARRNRWRYADADYDSDFTLGLRLGTGRQYVGSVAGPQTLWGLNPYVAVDGRFFGGALGLWAGHLGDFRTEGQGPGRLIPQLRARGGQLTGWHGRLSYAEELGGLGNPNLNLGGAYGGLLQSRLRLGAGLAVPTLALPGQEAGLYAELGLRTRFGEFGAFMQPPLTPDAPSQVTLQFSLGGLDD